MLKTIESYRCWAGALYSLIAFSSGCAQDPISHQGLTRTDLKYPSRQAGAVGIDYYDVYRRATKGDESALAILFDVTPSLDGLGSEEHSADLTKFLTLYGDKTFAAVLATRVKPVRKSVINALDFGFAVVVRQKNWSAQFPITYRLESHSVTN
jgi:hypothetical protein